MRTISSSLRRRSPGSRNPVGGVQQHVGTPRAALRERERTPTTSLYAATGTPVGTPSAYNIEDTVTDARVRTDTTPIFDFLFDMTGTTAKLYPPGALPGLARTAALEYAGSFEGTTTAPGPGWNDSSALVVDSGSVVLVRSRAVACAVGTVFEYAKLQILSIDSVARTTTFRILSNRNCGYRDLMPGFP